MKKVFNEELWEKYVQDYPEEFIGSGFKFLGKQIKLKRGRLDLLFIDKNEELVVVELQLKALDRSHFFRSIEYLHQAEKKYNKKGRIIILCNSVNAEKDYLSLWQEKLSVKVEVITMPEKEVLQTIKRLNPKITFLPKKFSKKQSNKDFENTFALHRENSVLLNENEKLKSELENSLPNEITKVLANKQSYSSETMLVYEIVQIGLELADIVKPRHMYDEDRAFCPFCRAGTSDVYYENDRKGFTYPIGLERHLKGSHGAHACEYIRKVRALVRPYYTEKSDRNDEEEEIERYNESFSEDLNTNKELYVIDPNIEPIESSIRPSFYPFLDGKQISAEDMHDLRLKTLKKLQFEKSKDDDCILITRQIENYLVYADITPKYEIIFRVFKINQSFINKGLLEIGRRSNAVKLLDHFSMKDVFHANK